MESQTYDFIFVGASPVMCLHAASLAANYRVLLIDSRDEVGGVWQSGEFDGHHFSCMVPHILEPHPGLYQFLQQHLELEMEDVFPDSFVAFTDELFGQKLHPYTHYFLHRLHKIEMFNEIKRVSQYGFGYPDLVDHINQSNPLSTEYYRPTDTSAIGVQFFKGGTQMFRAALTDKLNKAGCSLKLAENVECLTIQADRVMLQLRSGSQVTAGNVYLAQHFIPATIVKLDQQHFVAQKTTVHNNSTVQLKIRASQSKRFFYAYFPVSNDVYIAARLDYYKTDLQPNIAYVAITLKSKHQTITADLLESLVAELVLAEFLSADAHIEKYQLVEEIRSRFELEDRIALSSISDGRIRVVNMSNTGGLGRAIYDNQLAFQ